MKKTKLITLIICMLSIFQNVLIVEAKELDDNNTTYYQDFYNTGKDNGYSKKKKMTKNDLHYGWTLGRFAISGYTSKSKDSKGNYVFLKNVGDEITLYFNLEQNINKLDGKKNLVISNDKNGYDTEFGIKPTDFKKGTLIIRKIEPSGKKNKAQKYTNYLSGVKKGANTKVKVFEEGDYEVALDYEVKDNGFAFFDKYENYRIRFNFSVRNGNCMIFPMDIKTKSELINTSFTENGFYIDTANSKYLNINIKKEVLKEGAEGLVEDTRFNRPAKNGDEFTEEGIYTITVKNTYTKEETVKRIYVGKNNILKAHVQTGYSINDLKTMVNGGAKIDEKGNISDIPKEFQSQFGTIPIIEDDEKNPIIKYLAIIIPVLLIGVFIIKRIIDTKKEKELIQKKLEEKKEQGEKKKKTKKSLEEEIDEDDDNL